MIDMIMALITMLAIFFIAAGALVYGLVLLRGDLYDVPAQNKEEEEWEDL